MPLLCCTCGRACRKAPITERLCLSARVRARRRCRSGCSFPTTSGTRWLRSARCRRGAGSAARRSGARRSSRSSGSSAALGFRLSFPSSPRIRRGIGSWLEPTGQRAWSGCALLVALTPLASRSFSWHSAWGPPVQQGGEAESADSKEGFTLISTGSGRSTRAGDSRRSLTPLWSLRKESPAALCLGDGGSCIASTDPPTLMCFGCTGLFLIGF